MKILQIKESHLAGVILYIIVTLICGAGIYLMW